jgi:16S rRNA (guanine527-N7)-methyltransferase
MGPLYHKWNKRINVISRQDIDHLYERHILHSLSIARFISFKPGTQILDVGTGGGFPGIPLAVLFPEVHFHLVDSVGKKIQVVKAVTDALALKNVTSAHTRAEKINQTYDFIVSRAVTNLPRFMNWVKNKVSSSGFNDLPNGILYLKGGDIDEELAMIKWKYHIQPLRDYFDNPVFESKKIVFLYP